MPLKAGPPEVLDGAAILGELLGERVAEDSQAAVLMPVGLEAAAQVVLGLAVIRAVGVSLRRLGRVKGS